jgi:hypothetical protein
MATHHNREIRLCRTNIPEKKLGHQQRQDGKDEEVDAEWCRMLQIIVLEEQALVDTSHSGLKPEQNALGSG